MHRAARQQPGHSQRGATCVRAHICTSVQETEIESCFPKQNEKLEHCLKIPMTTFHQATKTTNQVIGHVDTLNIRLVFFSTCS